jgi:hypothetical protein
MRSHHPNIAFNAGGWGGLHHPSIDPSLYFLRPRREGARALLKTPHTHFKRGTPLRIILRDGQQIYDRYDEHGSGHIILREYGKLHLRLVKAVTIWKGGQTA